MDVTVYFATNRVVQNAADANAGYLATMVPPSDPTAITYGRSFITGIDVPTNAQGTVSQIDEIKQGGFSDQVIGDLSAPGRDLLLFIHGFDNTFSDAVTRAAFNAAWLSASGDPAADTTVIAFSWPSKGKIVAVPVLDADYKADQHMAELSGPHLMSFVANLAPLFAAARSREATIKTILLAHSMGNLALQSATEQWFLEGNGDDAIFDVAVLAAGDCPYNTFDQPNLARLSGLNRLVKRIGVYYSQADDVLALSKVINLGAQRLGQNGPLGREDATSFPPSVYAMVDCTGYDDYDRTFLTSHQYYRQSRAVREIIASSI